MENQSTNQPGTASFDFNKIPKANLINAAISLIGVIAVFLPWAVVKSISLFGGGGGSTPISGIKLVLGIFVLIAFLGILAVNIFGEQLIKLTKDVLSKINLFGAIGVLLLSFIQLIDIASTAGASIGFGLILALLAGVALLLMELKVIKI